MCINIIFLFELTARIYVLKFKKFLKEKFFIYEGFLSITLLVLLIIYFSTKTIIITKYCFFIIILKMARFMLVLCRIKGIGLIYNSLIKFLPYFSDIIGVLIIFFFIFSAIG